MTGPEPQHWFEPLADHLGSAYLRYSFTKGTRQEVDFLVGALGLEPGMRVLDVGCGPGRHAYELARRGIETHGVDISQTFVDLARAGAPAGATFERLDARRLAFESEFDAAISLCQGAFGLLTKPGEDLAVLKGMARAVRPGGRLAVSAFSAYFQVRFLDEETSIAFDAATGVHHERTELRDPKGNIALLHAGRAPAAGGRGRPARRPHLVGRAREVRGSAANDRHTRVPAARHHPAAGVVVMNRLPT